MPAGVFGKKQTHEKSSGLSCRSFSTNLLFRQPDHGGFVPFQGIRRLVDATINRRWSLIDVRARNGVGYVGLLLVWTKKGMYPVLAFRLPFGCFSHSRLTQSFTFSTLLDSLFDCWLWRVIFLARSLVPLPSGWLFSLPSSGGGRNNNNPSFPFSSSVGKNHLIDGFCIHLKIASAF